MTSHYLTELRNYDENTLFAICNERTGIRRGSCGSAFYRYQYGD